MVLTAKIREARDGRLDLYVIELPELEAHARTVADIPRVVREAAAILTGLPEESFDVLVGY